MQLPSINAPLPVAQSNRGVSTYDGTQVARANAKIGQAIGGAVTEFADKAIQKQDRYNFAMAKSSFLKSQIEAENELDQDQDYATYAKRYGDKMTKARDQAIAMVTSPSDRALFQQDLDLDIQRGLGAVARKAKSKETDVGRGALMDTIAANREIALQSTDDEARASVIKSTTDAIEGAKDRGYLTEQEAVRMRQGATEDYALASVRMLEPAARLDALSKPGIVDLIPTDKRAELKMQAENQVEAERRRLEAEARQRQVEARQMQAINRMELGSRVQDAQAAWSQGLEFNDAPTKADFVAAYGPEKAAKRYESEVAKPQALAPAIREFATADPQERQAILSRFQPAQDGTAGEGFKEDSQLYQHLTSVAVGLMKQQQTDPAAYVAKYSPVVQRAYSAAQEAGTPEAYQAYAMTTVAEQQRLGVQQPKLLPDAAADQLAATFNSQVGSGESAATMIEQQQQLWGKDFPAVLQQVGNKLPAEAQVIATGLPKDVAERMASVASIKDADLNAGLQKGQKDQIVQSVQSEMSSFAESLQGQSGGINTYSTMYRAALRTATSYVLQGDSPADAAKRVVGGMVNDKYDFFETYRVPKTLDTQAVHRGATDSMRQIKPDELMPLPGFAGVTEEQNLKQLHSALQSSGQWVPNDDESGLSLTLNGYRVRGKDGQPITRTWSDLQQKGLREPDQYRVAPMGFMP
jgi:hypothetical protein